MSSIAPKPPAGAPSTSMQGQPSAETSSKPQQPEITVAPDPNLSPRGASSGPPPGRMTLDEARMALTEARRFPTAAQDRGEWDAAIDTARLTANRVMSAHVRARDVLPPEQANRHSAALAVGANLLLEVCGHPKMQGARDVKPQQRDAWLFHSMLLMGQAHDRLQRHTADPNPILKLRYNVSARPDISSERGELGGGELNAGPAAEATDMPHEILHYAADDPSPVAGHQREGTLALAQEVRSNRPSKTGSDIDLQRYYATEEEMLAYMEESHAQRLIAEAEQRPTHPDFAASNMARLEGMVVTEAKRLNRRSSLKPRIEGFFGQDTLKVASYRLNWNPQAGDAMARILAASRDLHDAMHSSAWSAQERNNLSNVIGALPGQLASPAHKGFRPDQQLAHIATALENVLAPIRVKGNGYAMHTPAGDIPSPGEHAQAKADAAKELSDLLSDLLPPGVSATPEEVNGTLERACSESDFNTKVQGLVRGLRGGQEPSEQSLTEAVSCLVAALTGIHRPDGTLPKILQPEVSVYDPPRKDIPHAPQMNDAAQPQHKPMFQAHNRQIHIPRVLFQEPDLLAPRLARMATKLAIQTAGIVAHANLPDAELARRAGLDLGLESRALKRVVEYIRAKRPEILAGLETSELGTLILYQVAKQAPRSTGKWFAEGLRSNLKQAAATHPDPATRQSADEALRAQTRDRRQLFDVALERAVAQAAGKG